MDYDSTCAGCRRSQGLDAVAGGIAKLTGDWVVNQYGGSEGFLGWLALQPQFHRLALRELTSEESHTLGPNLQALDSALTRYWSIQFPDDPVERVYVVYLFESEFTEPAPTNPFHLHIHVIPRTRKLANDNGLRVEKDGVKWTDGWRTPRLQKLDAVPEHYQLAPENSIARATLLMDYIRHELGVRP